MSFKIYNSGRDMERCVYRGNSPYIFISYAHADSSRVFPIIETLHENGYRVWYDEGIDPGTEWPEFIAERISSCGYFIAFISDKSINSENCKDEMNFARDLGKERLLVYLEDVQLPPGMQMRLNRMQAVFHHKYDREEAFYDRVFKTAGLSICSYEKEASEESAKASLPKGAPTPSVPNVAGSNANGGTASKVNFTGMDVAKKLLEQTKAGVSNSATSSGTKINPATATPAGGIVQEEYILPAETIESLSKSGDPDNVFDLVKLANELYVSSSEEDIKEAVRLYKIAFLMGSKAAATNIGNCYYYGKGVKQDYKRAIPYYKKGIELGSIGSLTAMGTCYQYGYGVEKNDQISTSYYKKASDKGDIVATAYLGTSYYNGRGVEQNYKEAVRLYKMAAEKKSSFAIARLGDCYRLGHGIEQDFEIAFDYYWDAAELGSSYARTEVANCYRYGRGCAVNMERAIEQYKIAAGTGNKFAQDQLKEISGQ